MATIREIAEKAGVSITTVSRVLSKDTSLSITQRKKKLILEIADDLNYQSPQARKIQKKATESYDLNIACVLFNTLKEELDDPYYLSIHHAIRSAATRRRVLLDEVFYGGLPDIKRISQGVDGVIVVGSAGSCDEGLVAKVLAEHPVAVCVDFDPGIPQPDRVLADFRASIAELVDHFFQAGHRRIGYVGGRERGLPGSQAVIQDAREELLRSALAERGLLAEDIFLSEGSYNHENGYQLMELLLAR